VRDLERYRQHRLELVAQQTVNIEFRHLKALFNRARSYKYLQENPFAAIKPIRVPENDLPNFFELDEIETVRELFYRDPFEEIVSFYLLTGVRLREPLSLKWSDVDFRRKQLRIRSRNTKSKKQRIISFAADPQLETLLTSLPRRHDNKLFGPKDGSKQWTHWWVSDRISLKLTKAGFPWASCHTFRHTFISHLVMSGVPLTTVKELVGHSHISTTMRYAHLAPGHKEQMMGLRPY